MADSNEGFEKCLENVLCMLEGKGFKIILKSEQKKAIRQLYEGKDLLAGAERKLPIGQNR